MYILGEDSRERPTTDEQLGFTLRTNNGKATIGGLIFPPLSLLPNRGSVFRSSPDSEERLSLKGYVLLNRTCRGCKSTSYFLLG